MQQWEYMIVENSTGDEKGRYCTESFLERLNGLGKEGWEAVGIGISLTGPITISRPIIVLLKRPIKG